MIPRTPIRNQYRAQRWIVRRGPLIACVAITGLVAAKIALPILEFLGWPAARQDFTGLLEKLDRMPWPLAIFMLLAAWMTFFLGVPLWRRYRAYEIRRRLKGDEETTDGSPVIQSSKGARNGRLH